MKFEDVEVSGLAPAIKFMRNPLKSYDKADSCLDPYTNEFIFGDADYKLAKRLWLGGPEHRKWMRMVMVWANITAPRFFWQEFDTYRHVVKNSESTIHKLAKDNVYELFEEPVDVDDNLIRDAYGYLATLIKILQLKYEEAETVEEKNKLLHAMKQVLPEGFEQKRGVCLSYETLAIMYNQRKNHKMPEWSKDFVEFVKSLPYSEFITGEFGDEKELSLTKTM